MSPGCAGVRAPGQDTCFVHTSDDDVDDILLSMGGSLVEIDLRGTPLTAARAAQVTDPARLSGKRIILDCTGSRPVEEITWIDANLRAAIFDHVVMTAPMTFRQVTVHDTITFRGAQLGAVSFIAAGGTGVVKLGGTTLGSLDLRDCAAARFDAEDLTVTGTARSRRTRFRGGVSFRNARIHELDLAGCEVDGVLDTTYGKFGHLVLDQIRVADYASMSGMEVRGHASVRKATFEGPVRINGGAFKGSLSLNRVWCERDLIGSDLEIGGDLGMERIEIERALRLDRVSVGGTVHAVGLKAAEGGGVDLDFTKASLVDLSLARFDDACKVTACCDALSARDATFKARAELWLSGDGKADLAGAEFRERALIDGKGAFALVSLQRARCDEVRLTGVSLAECRFSGASGLADMGLSGKSFTREGGRVVLAEEADPEPLDHAQLAQLYRSLRRGLEDSKDFPGAADFYVSEMEMRRSLSDRPSAERAVINAYNWFAGYGVRPHKPFLWLIGLLVMATAVGCLSGAITESRPAAQHVALDCVIRGQGQLDVRRLRCDPPSATITTDAGAERVEGNPLVVGAVVARSSLGFSRALDDRLRTGGQWLIVVTRLLGAALLAFVLLGLRSMVRR